MVILKNTKNELKELLEKGFLCFIMSVQNLALNYEEDDNSIFDNNLIKVPEMFYKKIFKRNSVSVSEEEISQNKNRKTSMDSYFAEEVLKSSSNSLNFNNNNNLDMKLNKTPEKSNIISNISSFEDSKEKIEDIEKKMRELDLERIRQEEEVAAAEAKRKQSAAEDQLLKEKISLLIKKENNSNNAENEKIDANKYQQILKNVQESSFFNKVIDGSYGSEISKSPTNNEFKQTSIRSDARSVPYSYKDKILSSKSSKDRVDNFKEKGHEEKIFIASNSFKNFKLNSDISSSNNKKNDNKINNKSNASSIKQVDKAADKEHIKISNFDNSLKDVFVNYKYLI